MKKIQKISLTIQIQFKCERIKRGAWRGSNIDAYNYIPVLYKFAQKWKENLAPNIYHWNSYSLLNHSNMVRTRFWIPPKLNQNSDHTSTLFSGQPSTKTEIAFDAKLIGKERPQSKSGSIQRDSEIISLNFDGEWREKMNSEEKKFGARRIAKWQAQSDPDPILQDSEKKKILCV